MSMRRHRPALLGGLFIGMLSSLPVVNAGNLCCCLWVVTGGLLTVYLQQQERPDRVESSEAVLGGLIAGASGAVLYILVMAMILTGANAAGDFQDRLRDALDQYPQMPAEMRDSFLNMLAGPRFLLLMTVVCLPIYAVFSMLGALLGLAIFGKKTSPPMPPPMPPQA